MKMMSPSIQDTGAMAMSSFRSRTQRYRQVRRGAMLQRCLQHCTRRIRRTMSRCAFARLWHVKTWSNAIINIAAQCSAGTLNVQHVLRPCCVLPALHWLTMTPMQVPVIKTDGGPDRNNTFINLQLAYSLAKELGLDKLILMRTVPGQSYANPFERFMSVLNLALQGYATARGECSPAVEWALKGAQSMKATRVALSKADTHVACNVAC
jgi:hypothetical protein